MKTQTITVQAVLCRCRRYFGKIAAWLIRLRRSRARCAAVYSAQEVETLCLEQAEISPAPHEEFLWWEDEQIRGFEANAVGESEPGRRIASGFNMQLCRLSVFRFVPVIFGLLYKSTARRRGDKMPLSILIAVICKTGVKSGGISQVQQSYQRVSRSELRNEDQLRFLRPLLLLLPLGNVKRTFQRNVKHTAEMHSVKEEHLYLNTIVLTSSGS
ncbi:uncharacterized [Tachysurus ichikawai]